MQSNMPRRGASARLARRRPGQPASDPDGRDSVAFFKDEQQLYAYVGDAWRELAEDRERLPLLQAANTIVQFELRSPTARITIKLKPHDDPRVDFGPTNLVAEIVMVMDANTLRQFLLGHVNVTVALARGLIKARGPVAKILRLLPLFPQSPPDEIGRASCRERV